MLDFLLQLANDYWELAILLGSWASIALVALRRRRQWRRKQFLNTVNFSLNDVRDGKLCLRTLLETPVRQVWLNEHGVNRVLSGARRTTLENPFILLDDPEEMQLIHRAVLNVLSEHFAETYVAQALGCPVRTRTYVFGLTFEQYEVMKTRKLRVIVVEQELLARMFSVDEKQPSEIGQTPLLMEDASHDGRLETLRALYRLHRQGQQTGQPLTGRVVLGTPDLRAAADAFNHESLSHVNVKENG